MGDKNPPIQILMEDFADKHKDRLLFVEEHDCYYWLNKKYKYYEPIDKMSIKAKLAPYLESQLAGNITETTFNNAFVWLRLKVNKTAKQINNTLAIFKDQKVLNLETLEVRDHKEDDTIFYFIDCNFPTKKDRCPVFTNFLNQVLVDEEGNTDKQLTALIQEMFGYYLLSTQEPPVTFFLVGAGSNGKSTLQFVLEQIVGGEQFIMSNSIENLTTRDFHVQELRFKRLNICSEEQSRYMQAAKFKAMVEGTRIHAEVKFGEQLSFCPKCKHIFATNNMPAFDSLDYGTRRRIKLVPLYKTFLPHETDKTLKTKHWKDSAFAPELPAIIAWAVKGAQRLIDNNYVFSTSALADAEMAEYEAVVSSTTNFLRDNFTKAKPDTIQAEFFSYSRLYKIYHRWCKVSTNRKPVNSNLFRKEVRQELKLKQMSIGWDKIDGSSKRGFWLKETAESVLKDHDYGAFVSDREVGDEEIPV